MTIVNNVEMVGRIGHRSGRWNTRTSIFFLGSLTVVAAAARLLTLTRPSLSNDEAYTVALSQHGFWPMLRLFRYEANGLLYPLIYWPIAQFSDGPAALRMPALVAGVATVPIVYFIGRELAGRRVAVVGAVLIAISPDAIAESQNARAYSFALLLGSVSFLALLRARRGSSGAWAVYAVATALAGYAQILALFLIPLGQVVAVMATGRRFRLAWLRALCTTAVLATPAAALAVSEASQRNPLYWLDPPRLGAAAEFLMTFTVGGLEYHVASDGSAQLILLPIVIPLLWLLIIGAGFWRSRRLAARRWATDPLVTLITWAAVPPLVLFALSQVKPLFLPDRYLITSLPGACLLVAMAAERLPATWRRTGITVVVASSLAATAWTTTHPYTPDNRGVGQWLAANRSPSTPLIIDPLQRVTPLGYYDPTLRTTGGRLSVPEWHESTLPAGVSGYEGRGSYSPGILGPPTPRTLIPIVQASPNGRLIMVVELNENKQGDVMQSSGVRWLLKTCSTRRLIFTGIVTLVVSDCRAQGS